MEEHQERTDGELLTAFSDGGDQSAFGELARRYGSMVYGVCLRVVRDHHEAEDIAQAVFLTLARKAALLRRDPSVGGWLHTVARRLAKDVRNASIRRLVREEQAMLEQPIHGEPETDPGFFREQLDDAIGSLPERYRHPLVLFHLRGCPLEQTARQLRLNPNTLRTRLARAREMLHKKLVRRGVTVGSVGALTALLSAEAGAAVLPATFVSATVQAASLAAAGKLAAGVGTGVVSAKVAALTKGAANMLFWSSVKTAAVGVAAAVVVAGGGAIVAQEVAAQRKAAEQPPAAVAVQPALPVAPAASGGLAEGSGAPPSRERTICSGATTYEAARRDLFLAGVRVFELRRWRDEFPDANQSNNAYQIRPTPPELRRNRMPLADYVQALARNRGGEKVFWQRDGAVAILVKDVSNEEFAGLKEELASPDEAIRFMAAERAATFPTVPAVRLLIEVAGDRNPAVAEAARRSLFYLGWGAALALDEKVWTWMEADLAKLRPPQVPWFELALAGGERVLPALRRAVAEQVQLKESAFVPRREYFLLWHPGSQGGSHGFYPCEPITGPGDHYNPGIVCMDRYHPAVLALGLIPGRSAQKEIEALLQDNDPAVRRSAISALLYAGSVSGLAPLEKELREVSSEGAIALYLPLYLASTLKNERTTAWLRQTVRDIRVDGSGSLRIEAARALCSSGDSNDIAFVKSLLKDKDYEVVATTCRDNGDWTVATNRVGAETLRGENLLASAKKALPWDRDGWASAVLLRMNTPEARALLEERASNSNDNAWQNFTAFARFGLAKTAAERRAMIEKALTSGGSQSAGGTYDYLSGNWGPQMQHAREALKEAYRVGIPNRPNLWPQMGGKKVQTACQADVRRWQNGDYTIWYADSLFATTYYLGGEEGLDVLTVALPGCGKGWRGTRKDDVLTSMAIGQTDCGDGISPFYVLACLADGSGSATAQRAETLFLQGLTNQDVNIRLAAVTSLPYLGNGMVWSLLEKTLADPEAVIRWKAVCRIPRMTQLQGVAEQSLTLVEQATDDKDRDVREVAWGLFYRLSPFLPKTTTERQRTFLQKRLTDTDETVRQWAAGAYCRLNPESTSQVVHELLQHPDSLVRKAAVAYIREPGQLLEVFTNDTDKSVRLVAAHKLWNNFRTDERVKKRLSTEKMEALLIESRADTNAAVRALAVRMPNDLFGAEKVEALLTESLADPDAAVRAVAVGSLTGTSGLPWEKTQDKLLGRLAVETDRQVQQQIWHCLESRDCRRMYPHVEKAMQKYFLARLAAADLRELLQIKSSEQGRYPGDGLVLKAIKDREAALKAQGATELTPTSGTGPMPK